MSTFRFPWLRLPLSLVMFLGKGESGGDWVGPCHGRLCCQDEAVVTLCVFGPCAVCSAYCLGWTLVIYLMSRAAEPNRWNGVCAKDTYSTCDDSLSPTCLRRGSGQTRYGHFMGTGRNLQVKRPGRYGNVILDTQIAQGFVHRLATRQFNREVYG